MLMVAHAHPHQGGVRFAFPAGANYYYIVIFHIAHAGNRYEGSLRNLHEAVSNSHFHGAYHAAAIKRYTPLVVHGGIDNHLYPVDVGRKYRHENTARSALHDIYEAFFYFALAASPSDRFGSGTFTHQ